MADPTFSFELFTPASDLVTGVDGVDFDLVFARGGNDVIYAYDPIAEANKSGINIDILFGDLFDNTAAEYQVLLDIQGTDQKPGDLFAILNANIPSVGKDRFVLGDELQPYYTASNPFSLLTTNPFGFNDFSLIYDFVPGQDTIQLNGKKDDYALIKVENLAIQPGAVFSGYGLFSLQTGLPDLVSMIVAKPEVNLSLKDKSFQFVGTKPKTNPQDKKIGQFGTTGLDFGSSVTVDSKGNTYVVGSTSGSLFGPNQGSSDVWVTRYDSTGKQTLALQLGSSGGENAYKIVTDKDGNFYLAGSTGGSFVAGKQSSGGTDAWVAKYKPNGERIWGRQFGGNTTSADPLASGNFGISNSAFGLQVDDGSNVYLSGLTILENTKFIPGTNQPFLNFSAEDDSWVLKLDSSGNQQWLTKIKDPNAPYPLSITPFFDESYDLTVDKKTGASYLSGWSQGLVKESDPGRDLLKYDAWLSKVNPDGSIAWTQQFGSKDQGLDFAWANAVDSQGNIYVTGWTTGTVGSQKYGSYDVWLTKFDTLGNQLWAKQIGTKGDDGQFQSDIVIDAYDNIFVSGYTNNKLGSGSSDAAGNAWVGRFDTNGNNQWIQLVGVKDKADYATSLAVNNAGQVVVTGFTEGFLGSGQNYQAQGTAVDAWVAQLSISDGKLQNFVGNTGNIVTINNPVSLPSIDITGSLVTADKLPNGDNVIKPSGGAVNYGKILNGFNSALDPNSLFNTFNSNGILDNKMFNRTTKVDYKGTDKDEVYFGGSAADKLEGGKGIDVLYSFEGDDEMAGDEGDDILYGGAGNDKVEGGDEDVKLFPEAGDVLYGEAGDDELKGGKGHDQLWGGDGNDKLEGQDDNDTLVGGKGNDEVKGGKGADILIGIQIGDLLAGMGEIDKLQGEDGADRFVLGDASGAFYRGKGNSDYALIDDFKLDQGDKIQLFGSSKNYYLKENVSSLPKGTAIYHRTSGIFLAGEVGDLIGLVKDEKGLSLTNTNMFEYVV
jgi:Ca2+-binding RTX toxin-like protein